LTRLKEVTSTEKLLDFIRNKKTEPPVQSSKPTGLIPPAKRFQVPRIKMASQQQEMTIGVDIGHECLRLVKVMKQADKQWALLDYKSISFAHISSRKSTEFVNFLKSEMTSFCGDFRNFNIWAIMSAAKVNVRHIRIPKVVKKQIENAVYWTIKKETPFDEKDTIFDFEIQKEVTEQGVKKWLIMVYTAPSDQVDEIKKLFSQIGLQLTGISITPFAIQNIFNTNWFPVAERTVASLFIGNDFSRIDIYDQGKLIMTRGIKAGVNSMVELLIERIMVLRRERSQVDEIVPLISPEEARKVLFSLSPDSPPLTEKDIGHELTESEKFNIILPALERVVRQVERTFEHFIIHMKNERVGKIYVSTAMNVYRPFIEYVSEQLGIQSDVLDPLDLQLHGSNTDFQETSVSERVASIPALGLALSHNDYTPNLLYRFKDKEKAVRSSHISRIVSIAMITSIVIASGFFLYQVQVGYQKGDAIAKLEAQLSKYDQRIDRNLISQMAARAKDQQQITKAYSERYLGVALIGELSAVTPANIRLISVKANLGAAAAGKSIEPPKTSSSEPPKEASKETAKENVRSVVIEGVIFGDRKMLDSMLAGYIVKLESSPIFQLIKVQKNSIEPFKKSEVLHFILDAKIG
jgi:type IV pilus assembly protein PilM